ncbi:MAG: hypothetical protein RJA76_2096 [Bacteroidota bacterium]
MNTVIVLFYFSIISSVLPVLINIVYYKSLTFNCSDFKFWHQLLTFERLLSNIGILILMSTIKNSIPIYHFSVLFEFLIISKLFDLKNRTKFFNFLMFCGLLVFLSDLVLTSDLFHLNSLSSILTYCLIIALGWNYLYSNNAPKEKSTFLISVFLYYLGSIFYLLFEQYAIANEKVFDFGFIALAILSVLFNLSNTITTWSLLKK